MYGCCNGAWRAYTLCVFCRKIVASYYTCYIDSVEISDLLLQYVILIVSKYQDISPLLWQKRSWYILLSSSNPIGSECTCSMFSNQFSTMAVFCTIFHNVLIILDTIRRFCYVFLYPKADLKSLWWSFIDHSSYKMDSDLQYVYVAYIITELSGRGVMMMVEIVWWCVAIDSAQ